MSTGPLPTNSIPPMEFVGVSSMQAAFDAMPDEFPSDRWIAEIRRIDDKGYIAELSKKAARTKNPIQQTHADLASHLRYFPFDSQVEKIEAAHRTTSIKGTPTTVARWRKRKT